MHAAAIRAARALKAGGNADAAPSNPAQDEPPSTFSTADESKSTLVASLLRQVAAGGVGGNSGGGATPPDVVQHFTARTLLDAVSTFAQQLTGRSSQLQDAQQRYERGVELLKLADRDTVELQTVLHDKRAKAEDKRLACESLMATLTVERAAVERENAKAVDEAQLCHNCQEDVSKQAQDCQLDLVQAEPMLRKAEAALDTLNKNNLTELKSFKSPHPDVINVVRCVAMLMHGTAAAAANTTANAAGAAAVPSGATTLSAAVMGLACKEDQPWSVVVRLMARVDVFLAALRTFDKESLTDASVGLIRPFLASPSFSSDAIMSKSFAAAGLCEWVVNIVEYHRVLSIIRPKRQALKETQGRLEEANARLHKSRQQVAKLRAKLQEVQDSFEVAEKERQDIAREVTDCETRLALAQRLLVAVGSERQRWAQEAERVAALRPFVIGDALMATALLIYGAAFPLAERHRLLSQDITGLLAVLNTDHLLDVSIHGVQPHRCLVTQETIARWQHEGLPVDLTAAQNAAVLHTCAYPTQQDEKGERGAGGPLQTAVADPRVCLVLDPQYQGLAWMQRHFAVRMSTTTVSGQTGTHGGGDETAAPDDLGGPPAFRAGGAAGGRRASVAAVAMATTVVPPLVIAAQSRDLDQTLRQAMRGGGVVIVTLAGGAGAGTTSSSGGGGLFIDTPVLSALIARRFVSLQPSPTATHRSSRRRRSSVSDLGSMSMSSYRGNPLDAIVATRALLVGADAIPCHSLFRLILFADTPFPPLAADKMSELTLVNFVVTPDSVEEQLVSLIGRHQRPELESELTEAQAFLTSSGLHLKQLEDTVIGHLTAGSGMSSSSSATATTASTGNVQQTHSGTSAVAPTAPPSGGLVRRSVVEAIEQLKQTATELSQKVEAASRSQRQIQALREQYRELAAVGSLLFFCLSELKHLEPGLYHYALAWYFTVFEKSLRAGDVLWADQQQQSSGGAGPQANSAVAGPSGSVLSSLSLRGGSRQPVTAAGPSSGGGADAPAALERYSRHLRTHVIRLTLVAVTTGLLELHRLSFALFVAIKFHLHQHAISIAAASKPIAVPLGIAAPVASGVIAADVAAAGLMAPSSSMSSSYAMTPQAAKYIDFFVGRSVVVGGVTSSSSPDASIAAASSSAEAFDNEQRKTSASAMVRDGDGPSSQAASSSLPSQPPPSLGWISVASWRQLVELSSLALPGFEHVGSDVIQAGKRWRAWSETAEPETERLPGDWKAVGELGRLIFIKVFRPDRLMHAAQLFVVRSLGADIASVLLESKTYTLADAVTEGSPQLPILYILYPGADVTGEMEHLRHHAASSSSESKGGGSGLPVHHVSLGEGQEQVALELILRSAFVTPADAVSFGARGGGGWVVLHNVHLMPRSWLALLESVIQTVRHAAEGGGGALAAGGSRFLTSPRASMSTPMAARGAVSGTAVPGGQQMPLLPPPGALLNFNFRLILTAEVLPDPSRRLPPRLLERCFRVSTPPPSDLRTNLLLALRLCPTELVESNAKAQEFKLVVLCLCTLHAIMTTRLRYGNSGWSRSYPFGLNDLEVALRTAFELLDASSAKYIPWSDLRFMIADITYGGQITDSMDQRLCAALVARFLQDDCLNPAFELLPGWRMPPPMQTTQLLDVVESLSVDVVSNPLAVGLHPSTERDWAAKVGGELVGMVQLLTESDARQLPHSAAAAAAGGGGGVGAAARPADPQTAAKPSSTTKSASAAGGGGMGARPPSTAPAVSRQGRAPTRPALRAAATVTSLVGSLFSGLSPTEQRIVTLTDGIVAKLPAADSASVTLLASIACSPSNPFSVVLTREIRRLLGGVSHVRSSLVELSAAVRGRIPFTDAALRLLVDLDRLVVPLAWHARLSASASGGPAAALESSSSPLVAFVNDVVERFRFLEHWSEQLQGSSAAAGGSSGAATGGALGLPRSVWLGGLGTPAALITAVMQQASRRLGAALDELVLECDVLSRRSPSDVAGPPRSGILVHGVQLEGARWDAAVGALAEPGGPVAASSGSAYDQAGGGTTAGLAVPSGVSLLPVLHVRAIRGEEAATRGYYACPVYTSASRGVANLAFVMLLRSLDPPVKWTMRGVCGVITSTGGCGLLGSASPSSHTSATTT